jgi:hypothetical protein
MKFSKAKSEFYLMNKDVASDTMFKFLDEKLRVNSIRPNPQLQVAHNTLLTKGGKAKYNITRVELKSFTFSSGSQSLSIDNAVLSQIPKRLLFTMIKITVSSVRWIPTHNSSIILTWIILRFMFTVNRF